MVQIFVSKSVRMNLWTFNTANARNTMKEIIKKMIEHSPKVIVVAGALFTVLLVWGAFHYG